jgi:hypothetical protein
MKWPHPSRNLAREVSGAYKDGDVVKFVSSGNSYKLDCVDIEWNTADIVGCGARHQVYLFEIRRYTILVSQTNR